MNLMFINSDFFTVEDSSTYDRLDGLKDTPTALHRPYLLRWVSQALKLEVKG